ncbi:MAG: hypothetical protein HY401_06465 [Elusimicrobia bacterium]|nr:hypothetical protein [Elusimicrobiota bacterium]
MKVKIELLNFTLKLVFLMSAIALSFETRAFCESHAFNNLKLPARYLYSLQTNLDAAQSPRYLEKVREMQGVGRSLGPLTIARFQDSSVGILREGDSLGGVRKRWSLYFTHPRKGLTFGVDHLVDPKRRVTVWAYLVPQFDPLRSSRLLSANIRVVWGSEEILSRANPSRLLNYFRRIISETAVFAARIPL